jgi:hypothetical protein
MRHALLVIHFQDRVADSARAASDWLARVTQAMDAAACDVFQGKPAAFFEMDIDVQTWLRVRQGR